MTRKPSENNDCFDAARDRKLMLAKKASEMTAESLIDWLAQIAHDAREDWGWIREELLRRIPADLQQRGSSR